MRDPLPTRPSTSYFLLRAARNKENKVAEVITDMKYRLICAYRILLTEVFPQAQILEARNGHGGQSPSSWQECGDFACPHGGGGLAQGYEHSIWRNTGQ